MQNFTDWLANIYNSYGFKAFVIVILAIVLTNVIKHPIIRRAEEYARKYNLEKSVVTKWVALIPYGISFMANLAFVIVFAAVNKDWSINWATYVSDSALFATLSIAGFEIGKKCLESYVSRKEAKNGK